MACTSMWEFSPNFIIEPAPKSRSICVIAVLRACALPDASKPAGTANFVFFEAAIICSFHAVDSATTFSFIISAPIILHFWMLVKSFLKYIFPFLAFYFAFLRFYVTFSMVLFRNQHTFGSTAALERLHLIRQIQLWI